MSTYVTQSPDTTIAAERMQLAAFGRLPPWERLAVIDALSRDMAVLAEAGIRYRHPAATEAEVRLRRLAMRFDRATMVRVFGWDPSAPGA